MMLASHSRAACSMQRAAGPRTLLLPTRNHIRAAAATTATHAHRSSSTISSSRPAPIQSQQEQQQFRQQQQSLCQQQAAAGSSSTFALSFGMYLLSAAPALADVADAAAGGATPFQGVTANSLYVTLALFLMTAPGELAVCDASLLPAK